MGILLLVARLALALVFAVAGFTKLVDRAGTEKAVTDFGVPIRFAVSVAILLPLAEFAAAFLLMFTRTAWWGSLLALALLLIFTTAISYNLWKGRRPDCNCFGQLHSSPIGWSTLVRNGILILLAGFVAWAGPNQQGLNPTALLTNFSIWSLLGVLFGLLVIIAITLQSWFLFNLMRQNGRLIQRLEALEARFGIVSTQASTVSSPSQTLGLPIGSSAPTFNLPRLDDEPISLEALCAEGKPVLLLFSDSNCGPCNALMPTVALWQRQYTSTLRTVVISVGSLETNHMKQQEYGLTEVLLQKDREVATLYQAYGTPSAVLIRPDGTIGSALAPGEEAISALVSSIITGTTDQLSSPLMANETGSSVNDLSKPNDDAFPWLNQVEFWSGTLSWEGQQSAIRLTIREDCGAVTGTMSAVDPLDSQPLEVGAISGTRRGNTFDLVTNTGLQITAELTASTLTGQVVFPESYGEASFTSQISLAPIFTSFLPRPLQEAQ
jgi:uncharacterized membrane protein YphA (DoxX/SURF4 family)/peroxiredoxin